MRIAVLGGTGALGRALAWRFAVAGSTVVLGSRDAARAVASAAELSRTLHAGQDRDDDRGGDREDRDRGEDRAGIGAITGATNADAVRHAEVVVVAVPWEAHADTLRALAADLAGTIVVDAVNPIGFDARGAHPLTVPEGSAAEQAQALLPDSRVVAAFHTLPAGVLGDHVVPSVDADTFVVGDDREAVDLVMDLARTVPGLRAWSGGKLRNAGPLEGLTAAIISANRRHRMHAGIRLVEL